MAGTRRPFGWFRAYVELERDAMHVFLREADVQVRAGATLPTWLNGFTSRQHVVPPAASIYPEGGTAWDSVSRLLSTS